MSRHEFLTPDYKVQRSVFGEGENQVVVVVNMGSAKYSVKSRWAGDTVLPPGGFLIEAPTFVAFHALNWNGLAYADAPLFTLRSADGQPLARSRSVRVFHGFGDPRVRLAGGSVHRREGRSGLRCPLGWVEGPGGVRVFRRGGFTPPLGEVNSPATPSNWRTTGILAKSPRFV